ncbi:3-isopropylmalate dehydratase small subunit [uncultured Hyphomonas sp.]|uniref:3-isopropylmalate dehydratase small subunit n=1 Tax=uncultured Hyphomonas sp. TaxID=225298 RepID=UPI000C42979A|nr:3-isopropylmalate dehydratase small subunit [Hyphomonadaceae bacterium]
MPTEPFICRTAHIAALPAANIDTDVIMPKVFLKGVDRKGLEAGVFHDLRFDEQGSPLPDFVLNRTPWDKSEFLVAGPNFGCGSSREHAVWGLLQLGIRAIFTESFAGIFFDNCARNGLLAVELNADKIAFLTSLAEAGERVSVDLESQNISAPQGEITFHIDERRRRMLMNGLDAIGMTLEWREDIAAFQDAYLTTYPWLAPQ